MRQMTWTSYSNTESPSVGGTLSETAPTPLQRDPYQQDAQPLQAGPSFGNSSTRKSSDVVSFCLGGIYRADHWPHHVPGNFGRSPLRRDRWLPLRRSSRQWYTSLTPICENTTQRITVSSACLRHPAFGDGPVSQQRRGLRFCRDRIISRRPFLLSLGLQTSASILQVSRW